MATQDPHQSGPEVFEIADLSGSGSFDDALPGPADRLPPSWWQWRRQLVVVAALLIVVSVAAYAVGNRAGRHSRTAPAPTSSATPSAATGSPFGVSAPGLAQSSNQCATQIGAQLDLGIEIVNRAGVPIHLRQIDPVLPLAGLRATALTIGPCGQLGTPRPIADAVVPVGASVWISVVFDVLVTCPRPLPVQFVIGYDQGSSVRSVTLGGFADLGDVTYSGCDSNS